MQSCTCSQDQTWYGQRSFERLWNNSPTIQMPAQCTSSVDWGNNCCNCLEDHLTANQNLDLKHATRRHMHCLPEHESCVERSQSIFVIGSRPELLHQENSPELPLQSIETFHNDLALPEWPGYHVCSDPRNMPTHSWPHLLKGIWLLPSTH